MAQTALLSLLSLRSLSAQTLNLFRATRSIFPSHPLGPGYFSSLSSLQTTTTTTDYSDPKPSSLSARMSFVFDQIDAIERERSEKDDTLQRIRAWRESKKAKSEENASGLKRSEWNSVGTKSGELEVKEEERGLGLVDRKVEVVHPWREWIELMERLVQQNYFDHTRKDEDTMVENLGFKLEEVAEDVGFDFTRDWKTVQTACLNFGRDRFDILRSLSRQDIQILVGYGCPSADKKVVFSAKLLRKHVHLDEGDVCSSCNLRSSCERAYLVTNKEDEARTIDIVRILLTYGFNPINGSVVNESLLKLKLVKTVVRKLLHEVVKLSAIPIDPNLPPPIIKKPPPKVKQPPPPPRKRVGRDDIEMKMGDWLCPKCDFMNFAKNTVCLQCDAKRPKRQLLPGEWECPQCNFLNYRRNMVCFQCEHNRPPDEFTENQLQDRRHSPRTRLEKVPGRAEISNAWNFDFDDNESDGADVSAFEYADFPIHAQSRGENLNGLDDDSYKPTRTSREYGQQKTHIGFDDFDNEEDDSVESYELDTQNSKVHKSSSIDFSEIEDDSQSEDVEGFDDDDRIVRERNRPSKTTGSDSDDLEASNFRSQGSNSRHSRRRQFRDSDNEAFSESDIEDRYSTRNRFRGTKNDTDKRGNNSRDHGNWKLSRRRQLRDSDDDEAFSDESDGKDRYSTRNRFGGTKKDTDKRGDNSRDRDNSMLSGSPRFGSKGFNRSSQGRHGSNRGFEWRDGVNKSSQGSRGNNRGFRRDGYDGRSRSE